MLLPAQQHVGLQVVPVGVVSLNEYFRAIGTVQPIDSRVGEVSPLSRERIASVKAKIGDRERAGETLALFDNLEARISRSQPRAESLRYCCVECRSASLQVWASLRCSASPF
jgi:multidrug efflux pump subunit AcrA (membrane-fusion protein)